jgi:hypothetical protein
MSIHTLRLVLGVFFLLAAGLLFARGWLMPGLDAKFDSLRLNLGAVFALVFGALNLVRWYLVWSYRRQRAIPVRTPLQPDPSIVRPEPPNPELDFTKTEAEPPINADKRHD